MIFTARQLEQLPRTNGRVVLPHMARLTPLAKDWLRSRRIGIEYINASGAEAVPDRPEQTKPSGTLMWWSDGPCGAARAAVLAAAREAGIEAQEIGVDPRRPIEAVKLLATQTKQQRISAGVLLVESGALAMVFANRCGSLRAVLGASLAAVDRGISATAANVLVIEYPHQTLPQVRNMLGRFLRGRREPAEELTRQLEELKACESAG